MDGGRDRFTAAQRCVVEYLLLGVLLSGLGFAVSVVVCGVVWCE